MTRFRPKYITFDCYGTLTNFDMAGAARRVYGPWLSPAAMAQFIKDFAGYRLDEVLGAWKPYLEVVHNSVERTCKRNGVAFRPEDAQRIYEEVPTWGPHPDVPAGLAKVAKEIPKPKKSAKASSAVKRPSGCRLTCRASPASSLVQTRRECGVTSRYVPTSSVSSAMSVNVPPISTATR